jgi:hypothetical protein
MARPPSIHGRTPQRLRGLPPRHNSPVSTTPTMWINIVIRIGPKLVSECVLINRSKDKVSWPMARIPASSWNSPKLLKLVITIEVADWLPLKDSNNFLLLKCYQLTLSKILTEGEQHMLILFLQEKYLAHTMKWSRDLKFYAPHLLKGC